MCWLELQKDLGVGGMGWLCLFTQERSPGSLCWAWGSHVDSSVRPFHMILPSSAGLCLPVEVHPDPKPRLTDPTCGNQKSNDFGVFRTVKFLVEVGPRVLKWIESLIIFAAGCIVMMQELPNSLECRTHPLVWIHPLAPQSWHRRNAGLFLRETEEY